MRKKEISEIVEIGVKAKLISSEKDRTTPWDYRIDLTKHLIRFAKLVEAKAVAAEREACAKTLESISNAPDIQAYANAIRARGGA